MRTRVLIGSVGVLLGLFGVFRLLTQIKLADLEGLAEWLIGALILHDAILAPAVIGVGWVLGRTVGPRARRWVQGALIAAASVTVIALPEIYRQGDYPRSKALLQRNYGLSLAILVGIVVVVALAGYLIAVIRGRSARGTSTVKRRPSPAHDSPTE